MGELMNDVCQKGTTNLVLKRAETSREVDAAMKLRFEVFNLELNEGLPASYLKGFDSDEYDTYCEHILVIERASEAVVGTYRLLPGSRAEKGIGYYSETEFEMSSFRRLGGEKLELGRACVHRDYRGSAVLNLMWAGIARYIEEHNISYLFGCGSVHTINPHIVSGIYAYFKNNFMADSQFRVAPLKKVPGFSPDTVYDKAVIGKHMPALLTAYLRIGARIAGEPAIDEQFGVSDFLVLLDREKLMGRYRKHYRA